MPTLHDTLPLVHGDIPRGCHLATPTKCSFRHLALITPLNYRPGLTIIASHARASNRIFSRRALSNNNDSLAWNREIDWKLTAGFWIFVGMSCSDDEASWLGLFASSKVWAPSCVQCLAGSSDWLNVLLAIWLFALGSLVRISYRWINPELAKQPGPVWLVKYQISRQNLALKGILFIHRWCIN